jgi:flavin reductase (DIM6/NTAB) family NADH-FMN oxidoreductase RutF
MGGFFNMLFDFTKIPSKERYKLLVSTVTPRPIAWVVSQDAKGVLNAGAFSFFNAFSGDPPVVGIGMGNHKPGRPKDSLVNIRETGQFVLNLVSEENAEQMNITAIDFDPSVNELEQVVAMHVRDDVVLDAANHYIDTPKLRLLGRMHGRGWYARTSDLFDLPRIPVSDWKMKSAAATGPGEK